MTPTVGFVGLGRMGKPIAAQILAAGYDLMVFDLRDETMVELARLGAKRARSLQELSEHSTIIGVAVVDDAQVEAVLMSDSGLLRRGRRDSIIMIHSTIMPATAHKLAAAGRTRRVTVVDAPVSGEKRGRDSVSCATWSAATKTPLRESGRCWRPRRRISFTWAS